MTSADQEDELRVQRLLHQALDHDQTPEEVCADTPEFLPRVRERWKQVRDLDAQIRVLFPTNGDSSVADERAANRLPHIPGYEVESILGHGGMGVVYRARQLTLNRSVALKMLLAGVYASSQELERFRREARAAAGLRSAHIVQVFDVGELDGRPFFTMEVIEGGSLAQQLSGTPMPARKAAALLATIARAVHVAHEGGIVHRDLKPSNILLERDGSPKISDFGLARRLETEPGITRSGARMGTPSYMAPEQASGAPGAVHTSVDVYALGAILYEMLTGRPPFRADSAAETERQVIHEEPLPPSRLNPKLPRDVETICLKCLAKQPGRRYASAAELADDVERFLRSEPISARPVSYLERIAKWVRRRPARASIAGGTTLLVLLVLGVVVWASAERASVVHAASEDLAQSDALLRAANWAGARGAIERVKGRLGDSGSKGLREQVDRVDRDLTLVARLETIRTERGALAQSRPTETRANENYQLALEQAGIAARGEDAVTVAARIRASPVKEALVNALDDWALCMQSREQLEWVLETARLADPDPEWRDHVRDLVLAEDRELLNLLADAEGAARQPVSAALLLSSHLNRAGMDRTPFLRRVQFERPADYWVNFELGITLDEKEDPGAIGCYLAALAVRPDSVPVLVNLGTALATQRRVDESYEYYERALRIDPRCTLAHLNYAAALNLAMRADEAIVHAREAVALEPQLGTAHALLAQALWRRGHYAEARDAGLRAVELEPSGSRVSQGAAWTVRDCERRLSLLSRLPALLRGDDAPVDAEETAQFAMLCKDSGDYAAAARLYTEAFAASPQLAEDMISGNRMIAAESAAMLGRVGAEDGTGLVADERSSWRARSREWLRDELTMWTRMLETGDAITRSEIRRRVVLVREKPLLSGIRDPAELERLPPEERAECVALWRDFDLLQFRMDQRK